MPQSRFYPGGFLPRLDRPRHRPADRRPYRFGCGPGQRHGDVAMGRPRRPSRHGLRGAVPAGGRNLQRLDGDTGRRRPGPRARGDGPDEREGVRLPGAAGQRRRDGAEGRNLGDAAGGGGRHADVRHGDGGRSGVGEERDYRALGAARGRGRRRGAELSPDAGDPAVRAVVRLDRPHHFRHAERQQGCDRLHLDGDGRGRRPGEPGVFGQRGPGDLRPHAASARGHHQPSALGNSPDFRRSPLRSGHRSASAPDHLSGRSGE